jgi:hypothetical protein
LFEKVGRLAETVASRVSVSRRGFLGRLGQGALATAGVLGGFLLSTRRAGAQSSGGVVCCVYQCQKSGYKYRYHKTCQKAGTTCALLYQGCGGLSFQFTAATCGGCSL